MLAYISSFFRRNKRRLLISTGIISVLYLSTKYLQKKLIEFQERIREENFTKEQIKRRFQLTQKDCYMTFISLVSVLNEPILNSLPVEKITKELQMIRLEKQLINNESKIGASTIVSDDYPSESGASNAVVTNNSIAQDSSKKTKAELWSELKITTVARFLSIIYAQSILVVLIHIQLNILSRKSYLATAIDLASKTQGIKLYDEDEALKLQNDDEDTEGEKKFLTLTYYLISKGYQSLINEILLAVEANFADVNVRQEFEVEDFFKLVKSSTDAVSLKYVEVLGLLADDDTTSDEEDVPRDEKFENLKLELRSYIDNEETKQVIQDLVSQNVTQVEKIVNENITGSSKLATLLIQLTKNIPNYNADLPLVIVDGVADLSASVYSNF